MWHRPLGGPAWEATGHSALWERAGLLPPGEGVTGVGPGQKEGTGVSPGLSSLKQGACPFGTVVYLFQNGLFTNKKCNTQLFPSAERWTSRVHQWASEWRAVHWWARKHCDQGGCLCLLYVLQTQICTNKITRGEKHQRRHDTILSQYLRHDIIQLIWDVPNIKLIIF